ncbi:MAG: DUF1569 domain-containing protein, partial [Bacteroidota bacterium]
AKLRYEHLDQARAKLTQAMEGFHRAFAEDPERTFNHPAFGPLNYAGWLRFHQKHVVHHLTQFGLLKPEGGYVD